MLFKRRADMEEQESILWADEETTSILAAYEQGAIYRTCRGPEVSAALALRASHHGDWFAIEIPGWQTGHYYFYSSEWNSPAPRLLRGMPWLVGDENDERAAAGLYASALGAMQCLPVKANAKYPPMSRHRLSAPHSAWRRQQMTRAPPIKAAPAISRSYARAGWIAQEWGYRPTPEGVYSPSDEAGVRTNSDEGGGAADREGDRISCVVPPLNLLSQCPCAQHSSPGRGSTLLIATVLSCIYTLCPIPIAREACFVRGLMQRDCVHWRCKDAACELLATAASTAGWDLRLTRAPLCGITAQECEWPWIHGLFLLLPRA
ncbi:hypothetical protein N7532_010809 [Penicillium argentinense]|uniref:Uncharacterized protein n=1 Tax=Penicillium argentinense TaxID=1131581 RepID=A0A9W9JY99_9EURO|nr:uncharacterized protein N7532_010809 [Penicillium argentinense]KAJ5086038.1 hypothetical protein N7532_010809 [Penicillium argentinense]